MGQFRGETTLLSFTKVIKLMRLLARTHSSIDGANVRSN
jgi:hypothetical protein